LGLRLEHLVGLQLSKHHAVLYELIYRNNGSIADVRQYHILSAGRVGSSTNPEISCHACWRQVNFHSEDIQKQKMASTLSSISPRILPSPHVHVNSVRAPRYLTKEIHVVMGHAPKNLRTEYLNQCLLELTPKLRMKSTGHTQGNNDERNIQVPKE
jgi:hypothetical protein